jgi:hypothetical protein
MRAEFLLYTLTDENMRRRIAEAAVTRLASVRKRLLDFPSEDELPLPLDKFVVLLDALVPGPMFIRSQERKLTGGCTCEKE